MMKMNSLFQIEVKSFSRGREWWKTSSQWLNQKKHGQTYSRRSRVIYARWSKTLIILGHHGASSNV